jgi:hypothetical protein
MLPAIAFIMHFRQADPDSGKTDLSDERFDLPGTAISLYHASRGAGSHPRPAQPFGGGFKLCCIATFKGQTGSCRP